MKKRALLVKALALPLAAALALAGCAGPASSSPGSDAPSSAVEAAAPPTAAPTEAPTPTPQPELATVEGEVAQASKSAFALVLEDGSSLTVALTDETQVQGDALLDGCHAAVTYDENARTQDAVTALAVVLTAAPTPAPTQEPGEEADVEQLLSSMTLEEKVGQLFFVRVPREDAAADAAQYQFGGYILFGRDFQGVTAEQVRENIQSWQDSVKIPMLMGVDEEGGTVVRASLNPDICDEPYWSPRALYDAGGLELVKAVERDKIATLQGLGINVNFAPVCDISQEEGAFMYERSLGRDPETTAAFVRETAALYGESAMGCVLKHFPGYGNNADTHTGIAVDERPLSAFQQQDFLPFEAGIQAGAGCVLVSHNIVTCVDGEAPASLSPEWHRVLREDLGFAGCVITDDLIMDAIQDYCDASSAAVQAVLAGNDLLCASDYETQYPAVLEAVESGQISEARIDESVLRILRWKAQLGLL